MHLSRPVRDAVIVFRLRSTPLILNYILLHPSFQVNHLVHPTAKTLIAESAWCAIPFQDMSEAKVPLIMMIVTTVLFFVIPLIVVATLYCK